MGFGTGHFPSIPLFFFFGGGVGLSAGSGDGGEGCPQGVKMEGGAYPQGVEMEGGAVRRE